MKTGQSLKPKLVGFFIVMVVQSICADSIDWTFEDTSHSAKNVNDGQLEFLSQPPKKPVHHHVNKIQIFEKSLQDGWVALNQCHYNLDPVNKLEIVFQRDKVRSLEITESKNIGQAKVVPQGVQLVSVHKHAKICIRAKTLSLKKMGKQNFRLRNGPYMRKFLDGYYPMRVTVEVLLPNQIRFESMVPSQQAGFNVSSNQRRVRFDTWFEGELLTEMIFSRNK